MNSSSNATHVLTPPVVWAQRKDKLLITIQLENISNDSIDVTETGLKFKGKGGPSGKDNYEVFMEFFKEIVPGDSKQNKTMRELHFVLKKKEGEEKFWPRLLKDSKKVHYLKTDFNRWKDEDDTDDEADQEDFNLDDMMQSMGGLQGAGAGGGFGGGEEEDSDDEDLPDLQQ